MQDGTIAKGISDLAAHNNEPQTLSAGSGMIHRPEYGGHVNSLDTHDSVFSQPGSVHSAAFSGHDGYDSMSNGCDEHVESPQRKLRPVYHPFRLSRRHLRKCQGLGPERSENGIVVAVRAPQDHQQ